MIIGAYCTYNYGYESTLRPEKTNITCGWYIVMYPYSQGATNAFNCSYCVTNNEEQSVIEVHVLNKMIFRDIFNHAVKMQQQKGNYII